MARTHTHDHHQCGGEPIPMNESSNHFACVSVCVSGEWKRIAFAAIAPSIDYYHNITLAL